MTGHQEITVNFVILDFLFGIEREKQAEDLHEFFRDVPPDLHPQLKEFFWLASIF